MIVAAICVAGAVLLLVWAIRMPRSRADYGQPAPVRARAAATRRPVRADVPHALYRYPHRFRPGARYYGISNEPPARHRRHENDPKDRWWFATSTGRMVIIAWYPNRAAAQAAERGAVRAAWVRGEDIANKHHVPRPTAPRRKTRAARR